MLADAPECLNAVAALLGLEPVWQPRPATASPAGAPVDLSEAETVVAELLRHHPAALQALADFLQSPAPG
jgi:hypothetical protein